MAEITPIRPAPSLGNVRPIGDAAFADSFAQSIATLAEPSVFGKMSSPRRAILECLVKFHPALPTIAALRLCSGLNQAALREHLQALRWKGWLMFESLAFSPLTQAELIKDGILAAPVKDPVPECGELSGCATATAQPETPPKLFAKIGKVTPKSAEISTLNHEIAAGLPEPQQGRDGVVTDPPRDAVSATNDQAGAPLETQPRLKPAAQKARRVAAPVPAPSKTAGTGAIPIGSNWIANRFERIASAISFLEGQCILVQVVDRDELVKRYRVSGKRYPLYAEDLFEIAAAKGWAG